MLPSSIPVRLLLYAIYVEEFPKYEMGFVLFMDIVRYTLNTIDRQTELLTLLQKLVKQSAEFQRARTAKELIFVPTGDGMALVFLRDPLYPVRCALQLADTLQGHSGLEVRMGIHAGPVCRHADIKDEINVVGGGINMAQRVMDCGDAGHILVSRTIAEVLEQVTDWVSYLQDLGVHEVKHRVQLHIYNLYKGDLGNAALPSKISGIQTGLEMRPLQVSIVQRPPGGIPVEEPCEYLCYISRNKIDQLTATDPDEAPAGANAIPQLQTMMRSAISYGRPDLRQREASLKRDYIRKLQSFLRKHAHEIFPFRPESTVPALCW